MGYRREEITNDIEKDIIAGLIVDDNYCNEAYRMIRPDHFQSKHLKRVNGWVKDYYDRYGVAPMDDIRKIFVEERDRLRPEEAELIEIILQDISDRYAEKIAGENQSFNTDYLLDITRNYARKRNLTILRDRVDGLLLKGRLDEAENLVQTYDEVSVSTSKWINPFEDDEIRKTFYDDEKDRLFKLPGLIGDLTGNIEREWLIAFLGPGKRGKSWYLQEADVEALTRGLNVAHVSLEMNEKNVKQRIYAKLTTAVRRKYFGKPVYYPIFDCLSNQNGTCELDVRRGQEYLFKGTEQRPGFDPVKFKKYTPCSVCRAARSPYYIPAIWYAVHDPKELTSGIVIKKAHDFKRLFSDHFRVISYPPYGRSLSEIKMDLDDLRRTHKFNWDLLSIDYLDITAPEKGNLSELGQIDTKWKMAKGMAKESHCAVATVSQSGRFSFDKADLDESDISGDIRKFAHVDIMYGLNQTREEKETGVMRFSIMAFRHDEFSIRRKVMVLQSLKLGQPFIDSEYDARTYASMYGMVNQGKKGADRNGRNEREEGRITARQPRERDNERGPIRRPK